MLSTTANDPRIFSDLARINRDCPHAVAYLELCREEIRKELELATDDTRMRQLQGAAQAVAELLDLIEQAPRIAR